MQLARQEAAQAEQRGGERNVCGELDEQSLDASLDAGLDLATIIS